jgi:hypothetical protein
MLWKLTTTNKYGNLRSRIVHSDGALTIGQGFGPFVGVKLFRYESRSSYHGIMTSPIDGKKYLTPDWVEVHPQLRLQILFIMLLSPKKKNQLNGISNPNQVMLFTRFVSMALN